MMMKSSGARSDLPKAVIDLARDDQAASDREAPAAAAAEANLAPPHQKRAPTGVGVDYNDSGFRTMAIRTDAAVIADGRVGRHVTANGDDVRGFNYVTFDNGVTLYYPDGLDLMVEPGGTQPAE